MKKFFLTFAITLAAVALLHAGTVGRYNVSFHGVTTLSASESSVVYIYNAGTGTVFAAWGGHAAAATNDPATYHANRMPIRPGASYTTREVFSFVSVYCATNGLVDIGFEGRP